jgi:hypothetical protein
MKFEILKPVKKAPKFTNKYVLHLEVMHGDADKYEIKESCFSEDDAKEGGELQNIVTLLNLLIDGNEEGSDEFYQATDGGMGEFIKKYLPNNDSLCTLDTIWDVIGGDLTCEGRMCTPIDFKITYFDENGKEFKVKIS